MMNSNNPAVASRFAVMCRACMRCDSPTEPLQLHSIHAYVRVNNVTDTYTVVQLIESLAPTLQVKSDDGLPQRICPDCLTRLLDLRQFRQMCLKSDRRMRTLESETVMMPTNLIEAIAQKTEDVLQTELVEDLGALIEYDDELRVKAEYGTIINTVAREEPDTDVDVEGTEMLEFSANDLFVYEPKNEEQCFDHSYIEVEAQVTLYKDYSDIENSDELEVYELNTAECNQKKQTPNRIPNKKFIDITRQYQLHDESRPFQCSQCNYRFASLVSLKRHETKCLCGHFISNSREKCDLLLPNAEALFTHKPVYHSKQDLECNPIKFSCDDCEKTFENPALLTSHRRFHGTKKLIMPAVATSDKTQLYECQFCKQTYLTLSSLKDHIRTHMREQSILCPECGKAFSTTSNMKQHLKRHSGVMRYECPKCPRRFPCRSDLCSHKSQVHDEPRYECNLCNGRFTKPYQLKKHMMYHTGERPHKCDFCEKRFVCLNHMHRHRRTHTGEKPYKCKYCERAFAQSNDLIKHLRFHVGENVYNCELCPRSFRLASELRLHFAGHKNE